MNLCRDIENMVITPPTSQAFYVDSLPTEGVEGLIYVIPDGDSYAMYVWDGEWVQIGGGDCGAVVVEALPETGEADTYYVLVEDGNATLYTYENDEWVSHGGGQMLFETTYDKLVSLKESGSLIPGADYRITDFVTKINGTYELYGSIIHYAKSAEHPFDLIVSAIDASTLDEHAVATPHEGDAYFAGSNLEAWDIKYTIENDPDKYAWADAENGKGVIYYMKDEFENEAHYDFKNAMFVRYALKSKMGATDTSLAYNSSSQKNRYGSPDAVSWFANNYDPFGDNYEFSASNIKDALKTTSFDAYYLSTFNADLYYTFDYFNGSHIDASLNGTESIPCYGNVLDQDYNYSGITAYCLKGAVFETSGDVLGSVPTVNNHIGSNSYFCTFGLATFDVDLSMECLANTFGNNCNGNVMDFNCQRNLSGDHFYSNTFGDNCNNNRFASGTTNKFGSWSSANKLGPGAVGNSFGSNCNGNTLGSSCTSNVFKDSAQANTIGNSCQGNTIGGNGAIQIGDNSKNNSIGDTCGGSKIGSNCSNVFIGNNSQGNTVNDRCTNISIGNTCSGNTIKSIHNYITISDGSNSNSIDGSVIAIGLGCNGNTINGSYINVGDYCNSNKIGDSGQCSNINMEHSNNVNTIADGASHITFEIGASSNTIGENCLSIIFGAYAQQNTVPAKSYNIEFRPYSNSVKITKVVTGNDVLENFVIDVSNVSLSLETKNKAHATHIAYDSAGVLRQYCPADAMTYGHDQPVVYLTNNNGTYSIAFKGETASETLATRVQNFMANIYGDRYTSLLFDNGKYTPTKFVLDSEESPTKAYFIEIPQHNSSAGAVVANYELNLSTGEVTKNYVWRA